MAFSEGNRHRIDCRPQNWSCPVQTGQFESGKNYEFLWKLPLQGCVPFSGQTFFFDGEVEAGATVERHRERVIIDIKIRAKGEAACSRCLEKVELAFDNEFRYFYVSSFDESEKEAAESDEHAVLTSKNTTSIDIADQVWETLVMALPEKVLCREDCKGICPVCGSNRNYENCSCGESGRDPRLDVLADILSEKKPEDDRKGGTENGGTQK